MSLLGNQAVQDLSDVVVEHDSSQRVESGEPESLTDRYEEGEEPDADSSDSVLDIEIDLSAEADTSSVDSRGAQVSTGAELQERVYSAEQDLQPLTLGDFSPAQAAIRRRGFELANARLGQNSSRADRAKRGIAARTARALEIEQLPPPEFDPVPEATARVVEKSDLRLPDVILPQLPASPMGHTPQVGDHALTSDEFRALLSLDPGAVPEGLDEEQREAFEFESARLEELRGKLRSESLEDDFADRDETESLEMGAVAPIVDHGAQAYPALRLDQNRKSQIESVFAELIANSDQEARNILDVARGDVVIDGIPVGGAVRSAYSTIGEEEFAGEVRDTFEARIRALANEAGIAEEEFESRIAERVQELNSELGGASEAINVSVGEVSDQIVIAGERSAGHTRSVIADADLMARNARQIAKEIELGENIPEHRDRLLNRVTEVVAEQVIQYRQQGERRIALLLHMKRAQQEAYQLAAQRDIYLIRERARSQNLDVSSLEVTEQIFHSERWRDESLQALDRSFDELITQTEAEIALMQEEVREAGMEKREALRQWADDRLGVSRDEEERARQRADDEASQIEQEARAWAAIEDQRTIASIAQDLAFVDSIEEDVRLGLDRNAIIATRSLSAGEAAILDAYLTPAAEGESESRAIDAVAISTRMRLGREQHEYLVPQLAELIHDRPEDEWPRLHHIAVAQGGSFNAEEIAGTIRKAIKGPGTDEDAIFKALANRHPLQLKVIKGCYKKSYSRTLDSDLEGDLSGRELERAKALMDSSQDRADAIALRQAMHGNAEGKWYNIAGITGWGTDRDTIHTIMRGRDPAKAEALSEAYREISPDSTSLVADIHSELDRQADRDRFDAEYAGNFDLADAIELRQLVETPQTVEELNRQGYPVAIDRDKIEAIYSRIRTEVNAQAEKEGWTTDRLEGEVLRRNRQVETIFNSRYNDEFGNPEEGALRSAYAIGFQWRDSDRNLIEGLADNDHARADAARIRIEDRGIYADDDVQNGVLQAQYDRALSGITRDEMPLRRIIMARQLALREARDPLRPWLGSERFAERRRLERQIDRTFEEAARSQSAGNLNALREAYERDYGGSLDSVILGNTQGYDHDKAKDLLAQGSYLSPAQEVYYSIRGAGTNETALRAALTGRTSEELDQMRGEFAEIARRDSRFRSSLSRVSSALTGSDFEDMDEEIRNDLSGRTAFDIGQLLKGDPHTVEEQRDRLKEALEYELEAGIIGSSLVSGEREVLQLRIDELDATIAALNDPSIPVDRQDFYISAFENNVRSINAAIVNHRQSLDSIVETVSMAIAVAIAVVVGAVVSVFTLGLGGAVIAALIGSVLATASTIATKQLLLTGQYGWEDLSSDIVIGIVDALATVATAGLASKVMGAGKAGATQLATRSAQLMAKGGFRASAARFMTQGAGRIATASEGRITQMIPTSAFLTDMVERGGVAKIITTLMVEGGENFVQGTGSALATTILDENTWEGGNPLGKLASGTLKQAAISTATGMAAKPIQGAFSGAGKLGRAAHDAWIEAAHPTQLLPQLNWQLFKQMNPDATHMDYMFARAKEGQHPVSVAVTDYDLAMKALGPRPEGMGREAELRSVLPEELRNRIPVVLDSNLTGRTVRVEYTRSLGGLADIRILAGPDAQAIDIILHTPTVQAMHRYTGLSGRAVVLIERLQFWINKRGKPPVGSSAWEALLELNKLPDIINDRIRTLAPMDMDITTRMNILRDIKQLSTQIDKHQAILDAMDLTPGVGFVAAQDYRAGVLSSRPAGERADLRRIRYRATDSPLAKRFGKDTAFQVGHGWYENGRLYRMVEVIGADGKVREAREEILKVDGSKSWVKRGSDSNKQGQIAEKAAFLQAKAEMDTSGGSFVVLPGQYIQSSSGAGFDQVAIRFDQDGVATLIIGEVKYYKDRYVSLAHFTAIDKNLQANLSNLRRLLRDFTKAEYLGLTPDQMRMTLNALRSSNVEVQVITAPGTRLGDFDRGTVLKTLRERIRTKLNNADIKIEHRRIEESYMKLAQSEGPVELGVRPTFYELAGIPPSSLTPERVRFAQIALSAQNAASQLISPPLSGGTRLGHFQDSRGASFMTHDVTMDHVKGGESLKVAATDLVALLRSSTSNVDRAAANSRILLNVTDLTLSQRKDLLSHMDTEARRFGDVNILKRVILVDVKHGTANPVALPIHKVRDGRGD